MLAGDADIRDVTVEVTGRGSVETRSLAVQPVSVNTATTRPTAVVATRDVLSRRRGVRDFLTTNSSKLQDVASTALDRHEYVAFAAPGRVVGRPLIRRLLQES